LKVLTTFSPEFLTLVIMGAVLMGTYMLVGRTEVAEVVEVVEVVDCAGSVL